MTSDPLDRRLLDLQASRQDADVLLCGIPYDGAVLGRKGCKMGPAGIREAFRWIGSDDPRRTSLQVTWHDVGDLEVDGATVLAVHELVATQMATLFSLGKPVIVLGGDNSLSYPVLDGLHRVRPGAIGLGVVDAHYDMRGYEGQPTSGTPFRRVIEELPDHAVHTRNMVEVGIRRHANAASLGAYAAAHGVHIITRDDVRSDGPDHAASEAMARMTAGTDMLWLSIDIDAMDQSIASGCSAPSPDGLYLHEVFPLVEAVARDPRVVGMEIMETAPGLDPTGNTVRTAAALVARFLAAFQS